MKFIANFLSDSSLYLHPGSSGGPYIVNTGTRIVPRWTVAGIVSNSPTSSACPKPHSVFELVSSYRQWILNCGFNNICNL